MLNHFMGARVPMFKPNPVRRISFTIAVLVVALSGPSFAQFTACHPLTRCFGYLPRQIGWSATTLYSR
jgi:hypothetical protein